MILFTYTVAVRLMPDNMQSLLAQMSIVDAVGLGIFLRERDGLTDFYYSCPRGKCLGEGQICVRTI
jgi:hypothetical protein